MAKNNTPEKSLSTDHTFCIGLTDDNIYERIMNCPSSRALLDNATGIQVERCPVDVNPLEPETLNRFDAIAAGGSLVTRDSVQGVERCTIIVRYGAGYDCIDLDACTDAGIILATTPVGVRRPMATAALTFILALATQLRQKSKLVDMHRWDRIMDPDYVALGLTGKSLGLIGFGSIGKELHHLIRPFQMRHLVYDPYIDNELVESLGAVPVNLNALLQESDFVCIVCQLTDESHHLLGADQFAMMKPSAYIINVARGPIIDQKSLATALADGVVAGAALDALDPEPIEQGDPLLEMENVILTPHGMGFTDEMVQLCSNGCVNAAMAVRQGDRPDSVINRNVLETPKLKAKLQAYRQRYGDKA